MVVGRCAEKRFIRQFIEQALQCRAQRCLYISGAPGTGKTACVREVLRDLEAALLPRPGAQGGAARVIYVNAMIHRQPKAVFAHLLRELGFRARDVHGDGRRTLEKSWLAGHGAADPTHQQVCAAGARVRLRTAGRASRSRCGARRPPILRRLLVIDEIDQLVTADRDVLYHLFQLAGSPGSRLVLIGAVDHACAAWRADCADQCR